MARTTKKGALPADEKDVKATSVKATPKKTASAAQPVSSGDSKPGAAGEKPKKARKPYPTREERIVLAEEQIKTLTRLTKSRKVLVEKTEKTLNSRKKALDKCTFALDKAIQRRERLLETPEAKAQARVKRAAEKKQIAELMSVIRQSGKTMEDVLSTLKETETE